LFIFVNLAFFLFFFCHDLRSCSAFSHFIYSFLNDAFNWSDYRALKDRERLGNDKLRRM
jgi:hypothetical protein